MRAETRGWFHGLQEFAVEHREKKPLLLPGDPAAAAAERMILAAQLATWLTGWESVESERRSWTTLDPAADPEPALIVTTSSVGIAMTEELIAGGSLPAQPLAGRVAAVTELEYRLWCIRSPDEHNARHVNLWNWIKTSVPEQRHHEFTAFPLATGEHYWLHRAGIHGAGDADRRHCHLWKWNGRHAALLKAFVTERV
jgi:hypothetical protein